jgi:hypothetical protein
MKAKMAAGLAKNGSAWRRNGEERNRKAASGESVSGMASISETGGMSAAWRRIENIESGMAA